MRLTRGNPYVAGLVALALIGAVGLLAVAIGRDQGLPGNLSLGLPPARDMTVSARFDDANGLVRGAQVVEAGVPVGQVSGVTASGRQALVTMRIQHRYSPLHRGVIARIRYATLLAQKYVDLSPAAGTPALPDGATIPSDQTVTPVDFDQFLSTLDPRTRAAAQVLVQQLGGGVRGRGETLNLLLDQASGLAEDARGGLAVVNQHDADLAVITDDLAVTSARLAQSRAQLGDLVASLASVVATLTANDASLDDLLARLARVANDIDQTLGGNEANLHQTVASLDPFLSQLNSTLGTTYPYLHGSQGQLISAFNSLIPFIGSAIAQRDANGNYLRQYLVIDTCYDQLSTTVANPATGAGCLLGVSNNGAAAQAASQPASSSTSSSNSPASSSGRSTTGTAPRATPTPCSSPIVTLPSGLPSLNCPVLPCLPVGLPAPSPSPSPCPTNGSGGGGLPLPLPSPIASLLGMP